MLRRRRVDPDSACSVPSFRCRRHVERCGEYSPSRRSRAPIAPSPRPASACSRIERLYSAVNFLRTAFSGSSGSGRAGLLGPSKASVTARSRTPARDPSGFRAAVRFTPGGIEFIPHRLMFNPPRPHHSCWPDSVWTARGFREKAANMWTACGRQTATAHKRPTLIHRLPTLHRDTLGCRSFAITTNLIDHQKQPP
jgi:hypothetical protein